MRERYVLVGLARARSTWFSEVARWANAASIPAEFVKCISGEELRARVTSGRPFSAALLDGGLPAVDRDLIEAVREAGCVPIVVEDRPSGRDWAALGAAQVIAAPFERQHLLDVLSTHATVISTAEASPAARHDAPATDEAPARVVTVCGGGGAGTSTVAIALAQQLAADAAPDGRGVVLADLCLVAEQAMLHDTRQVVPGVQELVEAHRAGRLGRAEVVELTYHVVSRGYRLLLGLRRPRFWPAIRPRAFQASFDSLRTAFDVVICDVDADFEGEEASGSVEVEERNVMARTAARASDVVLVVGRPGMKHLHGTVRLVRELQELGVPAARIVPVINCAPRNPRQRAEIAAALADLTTTSAADGGGGMASPIFLPERRVDQALRDGVALPAPLGETTAGAYRAALARAEQLPAPSAEPEPVAVAPGSLGTYTEQR
jgi:MinD-like ATPase involved in chromosome partitioning or flagellar assembly